MQNGDEHGHISSTADIDFHRLNRYPDPYNPLGFSSNFLVLIWNRHQTELKQLMCNLRNTHIHTTKPLKPENCFVGVGSDEVIDTVLRCFCTPGHDKIITCPPTYGMYTVSAHVNDVNIVKIPLDTANGFSLRPGAINEALSSDPSIKVVYICSPGNPTASLISKSDIEQVLEHPAWNGIIVLDEAYIDFAYDGSSLAQWVTEWPNLVVMQTLSKAFGLAGIRLGFAFTSPEIATLFNNLKAPYNISSPTSALARTALGPKNLALMRRNRENILEQRERLLRQLLDIPGVGRLIGGIDSNYVLVQFLDTPNSRGKPCNKTAMALYTSLAESRGIIVRFRGKEFGCEGCLRITIGTAEEVDRFLKETRTALAQIFQERGGSDISTDAQAQERIANDILA